MLPATTSRAKTVILGEEWGPREWSRGTLKRWSRNRSSGTEYQSLVTWSGEESSAARPSPFIWSELRRECEEKRLETEKGFVKWDSEEKAREEWWILLRGKWSNVLRKGSGGAWSNSIVVLRVGRSEGKREWIKSERFFLTLTELLGRLWFGFGETKLSQPFISGDSMTLVYAILFLH